MGGTYLLILWIFRLETGELHRGRARVVPSSSPCSSADSSLKEKINRKKKPAGFLAILAGLVAIRLG